MSFILVVSVVVANRVQVASTCVTVSDESEYATAVTKKRNLKFTPISSFMGVVATVRIDFDVASSVSLCLVTRVHS